ncbi:MAG: hypothetical protein HQ568_05260 [Calditrichaeota bacterium]|nr:hypothetical protein [Calditrichota bacterium]
MICNITAALAILLLFSVQNSPCQDKYERKSISYVNALWLASPSARGINNNQVSTLLKSVKSYIEMERFDYNPLPEALIHDFVAVANAKDSLSVDQIADLMQEKLTPVIVNILAEYQSLRSEELLSEDKKQTFLATKAKESGITLAEIEKVMNAAYIYLPVLTGFSKKQDEDTGKITYTIKGGIIWFHVSTSGDEPKVNLKVSKTTFSSGYGRDDFAWESAVMNFARNLKVATQEIAEFKLSIPISEVDNGTIGFKMGTKEGIHVDDCFFVGEWVEYSGGDIDFEQSGWVRIGKVGDNRNDRIALSYAWAVKKDSWVPGMVVVEHPRLGIDIAFKPMVYQLEITAGTIQMLLGGDIEVVEDYSKLAPGFDIDAHYNLGALTGVSQLFFLFGGNFVFPLNLDLKSSGYTDYTTSPAFVWGVHGGFMKKFYFRRAAFSLAAKGGLRYFTVKQDIPTGSTDIEYTICNQSYGGQVDIGFEYAVSPDFHIGIMGGFQMFPDIEIWNVEVNQSGYTMADVDDQFPDVNHVGPCFGIYMHFTPPALPFDPASFIKGAMQE